MLEWGAKTIPEGGYYALPERMSGDGVVLLGDAAGFVDVPSLKGIHYAMKSGMLAARAIFDALKKDDVSAATLAAYDRAVHDSFIVKDMLQDAQHAPGVQERLLHGRHQGVRHAADRRRIPRRADQSRRGQPTSRAAPGGPRRCATTDS